MTGHQIAAARTASRAPSGTRPSSAPPGRRVDHSRSGPGPIEIARTQNAREVSFALALDTP